MTRFIKRGGKIWVRVFPDKPITKKPQETRMGKGKGAPEEWVCVVRPGRILFEMEGVTPDRGARSAEAGGVEAAHPHEVRDPVRRGEGVMMDVAELRDLSVDDLEARAKELEDQLFRMRHPAVARPARCAAEAALHAPRSGAHQDGDHGETAEGK